MDDRFTVVLMTPDVDGVAAGALAGRAVEGRAEAAVYEPAELTAFFETEVQAKLPRGYDLALCGHWIVHTDWDGRLVRPHLMDALRAFMGPMRWYSAREWEPEDLRAVGHLIGEGNLVVSPDADSTAEIVRRRHFGPDADYEDALARFASGRLTQDEEQGWGRGLRRVLTCLKAEHYELAAAAGALMEQRRDDLVERWAERAERTEQENREFARSHAEEPLPMGDAKLVFVSVPGARHPFWAEISRWARREKEAEFSLCRLEGRAAMILARGDDVRADLRPWARYVTDLLGVARTVGAADDVVPLVIGGLTDDPGLKQEVLGLLKDGAHLLKG